MCATSLPRPTPGEQVVTNLLVYDDVDAVNREWTARGAAFLTEPIDNQGLEIRCHLRDPSGHLIEVG